MNLKINPKIEMNSKAPNMNTTPKMDSPQKNAPKNVEDLSEVKWYSK